MFSKFLGKEVVYKELVALEYENKILNEDFDDLLYELHDR